jgi:LacI family transcriptional regulator
VRGAEDACRNAGFALVLSSSGEDRAREAAHLQTLQDLRCDGALIIVTPEGPQEAERRERLERFPLPAVYLDRLPGIPADTVVADNFNGGHEATRYLIRLGHRRIALVTVDYEVSSHRDRRSGYLAALKEAGLGRRPELEAHVPLTVQDGFSAASALLALPERPTAFFVTSSALTIGTVSAIQARGLRCPQDASVIGYDSYEWQEVFAPRLSTIKQPAYLIGQRAAELLLDRVSGKKTGAREKLVLRTTLLVRDSCEALREGAAPARAEPPAAAASPRPPGEGP